MAAASPDFRDGRLAGLRRFAVAISILNLLGHTVLGFEQSWAQLVAALATAYALELLLEMIDATVDRRRPRFRGGFSRLVDFLLSAHITGLAVAMLLYASDRLAPIIFAAAVAIGSKAIFRLPAVRGGRHFLNPSNFGIATTLLLFPSVGIAPPYQFTENLSGPGDWLLPALLCVLGTLLNHRFTGRLPLIAAWLTGFALQALVRSVVFDTPTAAALVPMTGVAFVLYTFYMVTDPATTPSLTHRQIAFGLSVAAAYGALMATHVVFGLFFSLAFVCAVRGVGVYLLTLAERVGARERVTEGPSVGVPS